MDSSLYDEIAECGEWDYEWHIGMLLRRKSDGQLFFGATGGCSCNDYWENLEDDDLKPVETWQQAVELAKAEFSEAEATTFAERLVDMPADCRTAEEPDRRTVLPGTPRPRARPLLRPEHTSEPATTARIVNTALSTLR